MVKHSGSSPTSPKKIKPSATLVAVLVILTGFLGSALSACSVHYHHHGKKGGHGGVIITVPAPDDPEVGPIPEK